MDSTLTGKRKRELDVHEAVTKKRQRSISPASSHSGSHWSSSEDENGTETPITPITPRSPSTKPSTKRPLKYFCDFPDCTKAFSRPVRLEEHKRSHTNERIFKCPHPPCTKDFLRESHLKAHVKNTHTDEREHTCDWEGCDKAFTSATRLRRHRETHEKPKKNDLICTGYPPCSEVFKREGMLQKHINSVHLQLRPLRCPHSDPTTGQPCQSSFDKPSSLQYHEAQYHGEERYSCSHCPPNTTFPSYNQLQSHISSVHPPYCEQCGFVCSSAAQLRSHIDICHENRETEDKPHLLCPYEGCDKIFNKSGNLKVHVRTQHENERKFKCGGTDLSASTGLEVWNAANACGKAFTTKQSLANHVRNHHLSDSKPKRIRKQEKKQKVTAVEKLTGNTNRIRCLVSACPSRFRSQTEAKQHAMSAHGMSDSEITEATAEREALTGGKFWVGGSENEEDDFTGLGREAVDIRGQNSGQLPSHLNAAMEKAEQQSDAQMGVMLSSFVDDKAPVGGLDGAIDPVLLSAEQEEERSVQA